MIDLKLYNAKVNGKWAEAQVTSKNRRIKKGDVLGEFQKYDPNIRINDIYLSINAPDDCPYIFDDFLFSINL